MGKIGGEPWGTGGGGFGMAFEAARSGGTVRIWPILLAGLAIIGLGIADSSPGAIVMGAVVFLVGAWWLVAKVRSTLDALRLERRAALEDQRQAAREP